MNTTTQVYIHATMYTGLISINPNLWWKKYMQVPLLLVKNGTSTWKWIYSFRPKLLFIFNFSRYIVFYIHLNIYYVYINNKSYVSKKIKKRVVIWDRTKWWSKVGKINYFNPLIILPESKFTHTKSIHGLSTSSPSSVRWFETRTPANTHQRRPAGQP